MNLKIQYKNYDFLEPIKKDNSLFLINKFSFFEFYYYFFQAFQLKNKDIEIQLGEKILDYKNSIFFSFLDFTEILNSLEFKKGSLFYDYLISCLYKEENLDQDILFYDLANIIQNVIKTADIDIDYDINEDIEKIVFGFTDFKLKSNFSDFIIVLNKILDSYLLKNINKTFIIFYDSSLLNFDFSIYDNCYSFDISDVQDFPKYNLICGKEIHKFDLEKIMEKLEGMWPVEFNRNIIERCVVKFYLNLKSNLDLVAYEEQEYLTYQLLNKMFQTNLKIICKCTIRDNVKSFLEQI